MPETPDDHVHHHPTVQKLIRSHRRLWIVAIVLAVACLFATAGVIYDNTIGYDRPAVLG